MSEKKPCINNLLDKLTRVDNKMCTLKERLKLLKETIKQQDLDEDEEECPDVVESEKAVVQAIEKLYVEELLTREPEGDA